MYTNGVYKMRLSFPLERGARPTRSQLLNSVSWWKDSLAKASTSDGKCQELLCVSTVQTGFWL